MSPSLSALFAGKRKVLAAILIVAMAAVPAAAALQPYMYGSYATPVAYTEPVAVVNFPPFLIPFVGDSCSLSIEVMNSASVPINCYMEPMISNAQYEQAFVTYTNANTVFILQPGLNTVVLSFTILAVAPPLNDVLVVYFWRTS